jgi:nucleoid DNA-binding protein
MAENKTQKTRESVSAFIESVPNEAKRRDARTLLKIMRELTGEMPVMWGASIVGFGAYHYKYESGREGDMPITGFSPRKAATAVYIMTGFAGSEALLAKLGPHSTGKACLYIKKLSDVDQSVLRKLIARSVAAMRKKYPA